jgi:hypothetical protein
VPLATWYRFRLQAEKSRSLLLLITPAEEDSPACAQGCAAAGLRCRPASPLWRQATPHSPRLLAGVRYHLQLQRSRAADALRRKPVHSEAAWLGATRWAG